MNLRFFFKIGGAKETVASAFLATLLESDAAFRQRFLDLLASHDKSGRLASLASSTLWNVSTEVETGAGPVDIELRTENSDCQILIENKVFPGSLQHGQLRMYYQALANRDPTGRTQIGAVFLGPGTSVGEHEVELVRELMRNRIADFAARIGWLELAEIVSALPTTDATVLFAKSGFDEVTRVIADGGKTRWPLIGDRKRAFDLATIVRDNLLRTFPQIQLGYPWPASDNYTLWTQRSNVTMWLMLRFEVEDKPPFEVRLEKNGLVQLSLTGQLKLSAAGRRLAPVRSQWEEKTRGKVLAVAELGPLSLSASGWATIERVYAGTQEEVVAQVTDMGRALIAEVLTYGAWVAS